MSSEILKDTVQSALRYFGLELRRAGAIADPFVVQRELISAAEPVIFDVGAHVGTVARRYRGLFPRASIWCFEPFLPSFQTLQQNLSEDPRISVHNVALSDRTGLAKLHANLASVTNSLLASDERGKSYWGEGLLDTAEEVDVRTTTVDDFVADHGIRSIDILKLDVQGAEFNVLTGARHTLEEQKINLIYTELILCPTYQGQHEFHEYLKFLDSVGYTLLDLFNPERNGRQLIQADIVFLSSSFRKRAGRVS